MANIVTYIEVREGSLTLPSLYSLSQARRVATSVGATVYGILALPPVSNTRIDELASIVSEAGADRVLCCSNENLSGPTLDVTHGPLLADVSKRLLSPLVLLPAGSVALEIGPALSIRLGGAFMLDGAIEIAVDQRRTVRLRRLRPDRTTRVIDVREFERPLVASLAAGSKVEKLGTPNAEVEMLPYPSSYRKDFTILSTVGFKSEKVELASHLIIVGNEVPRDSRNRLEKACPLGTVVISEDEVEVISLGLACPETLIWISPEKPWKPEFDDLVSRSPSTTAYFIGQSTTPPPSPVKIIRCETVEQLSLLLGNS